MQEGLGSGWRPEIDGKIDGFHHGRERDPAQLSGGPSPAGGVGREHNEHVSCEPYPQHWLRDGIQWRALLAVADILLHPECSRCAPRGCKGGSSPCGGAEGDAVVSEGAGCGDTDGEGLPSRDDGEG